MEINKDTVLKEALDAEIISQGAYDELMKDDKLKQDVIKRLSDLVRDLK